MDACGHWDAPDAPKKKLRRSGRVSASAASVHLVASAFVQLRGGAASPLVAFSDSRRSRPPPPPLQRPTRCRCWRGAPCASRAVAPVLTHEAMWRGERMAQEATVSAVVAVIDLCALPLRRCAGVSRLTRYECVSVLSPAGSVLDAEELNGKPNGCGPSSRTCPRPRTRPRSTRRD